MKIETERPVEKFIAETQQPAIKERLEKLEKHSRKLFESQARIKTLMLAADEYLLHFT